MPDNHDLAVQTLRAMKNLSWKAKVAMLTKIIDDAMLNKDKQ